jgi:probable HAF family extracellular repeat protein
MSLWKTFEVGIFATLCLLGKSAGPADAQCSPSGGCATEWNSGKAINLGALPGFSESYAWSINNSGQAVGYSYGGGGPEGPNAIATQWSGGSVIPLGGLPGFSESFSTGINDRGTVVGYSEINNTPYATEWSGGSIINLTGLPGFTNSLAEGINNSGQSRGSQHCGWRYLRY